MYAVISAPAFPMPDDAAINYANATAETAMNPGALTNPGFIQPYMLKDGTWIEMHAWGTISTSGTTPTFIWKFLLGQAQPPTVAGGVNVAATSAITLTNQAAVAWPWRAHYFGRFTQTGTAGSLVGSGTLELPTSLTLLTPRSVPETIAARTVAVNTSVPMAALFTGTWSAAAVTNIATCDGLICVVHG
jgi:hypothetical protein